MKLSNVFQLNLDIEARELTLLANFDRRCAHFGDVVTINEAIRGRVKTSGNIQEALEVRSNEERYQCKFTDFILDSENLNHPIAIQVLSVIFKGIIEYEEKMAIEENTYDDLPSV